MTTAFESACSAVDAGADPAVEATALVAEMTLDERLGCLDGDTPFWPGLFDMTSGGYYRHTWPAAVVERLGIPGIEFSDGPRGAVIADATAFPVSMGRGAMFDPDLEARVGDAIGAELRASGATFTGAVCMNLLRHPAWGRAQETYGEDPHHVGAMAAAFTTGLERHVMACMKHFALNSMENARFTVDVSVDERALHEVYLPHFRRVAENGIASVMSAYNSVNGAWCGEHRELLTDVLRDEWEWPGFVVSDFVFGLRDAVESVRAGLDIEMPFRQQRAVALADAVADGRLDIRDVDAAIGRIVATLLRYRQVFAVTPSADVVGCADHGALARRVAATSTVMLRNHDDVLPVESDSMSNIVVIGELADVANLGDGGSSDVKSTAVVTPLAGIRERFGRAEVTHVLDPAAEPDLVASADLAVVVVGYTKDDEGEYVDAAGTAALAADLFPPMDHPELGVGATSSSVRSAGEAESDGAGPRDGMMSPGGDRDSLRLSARHEELIAAVAAANPNTVVSVQCGSAVTMPWIESVPTVLVSWYGGVEGGNALADILAGDVEPGGRLPFAIPHDAADLVHFDKNATEITYDLLHGQWHLDAMDTQAAYPFGAGLGFTQWSCAAASAVDADTIRIGVANTGSRRGSTVVFVHAGVADSSVARPPKRLVGFARVAAEAGQSVEADIAIDWRQLDVRRDGSWWTEPGRYELHVGFDASSSAHVVTFDRR